MTAKPADRYCGCGTRLARDNTDVRCAACTAQARDRVLRPPVVPAEFWATDRIRDALASHHLGRVIAAYRHHPFHGAPIQQKIVAGWGGITQAQLSRIENGPPVRDLDKLIRWARTLGIPAGLLWFRLPGAAQPDGTGAEPCHHAETDEMNRRDLLHLLSMTGALLAADPDGDGPPGEAGDRQRPLALGDVARYAAGTTSLWRAFGAATRKVTVFPAVRGQLRALTDAMRRPQPPAVRRGLAALAAEVFQLGGEILFDCNRYTDAAHCYTLAATASRDADAPDLWACALTRHAYLSIYEQRYEQAAAMLDLAGRIARRGDSALSTRHWVASVQAQALAGCGDLSGCQRSLDAAEAVGGLGDHPHNDGWLRFDGSRLAEERGACYTRLGRPDLAEPVLTDALDQQTSARRRGVTLVDLATVGAQLGDTLRIVTHAGAALETARTSGSGVLVRRLRALQPALTPYQTDRHVRHLDAQITALAASTA